MKILILAVTLFLLNGCTGLSKSDCQELDMIDTGYFDAAQGYDETHYDHWVERCQKHKFVPDKDLYFQGRKRAYYELCNFENGYMDGQNKKVGLMYCPSDLKEKYNRGFSQGSGESKSSSKIVGFSDKIPNNKICVESKECIIEDTCKYNKCLLTGSSCLLDRDCTLSGTCDNKKCNF